MEIIGIIPVRWKSSRFPGKPLANILGKSLVRRTYENAKRSKFLRHVVIATDDQRIIDHVQEFGADVVETSPDCPTGTDRVAQAVSSYFPEAEIVVNIQGDEPCLDPDIIDTLVNRLVSTKEACISTPIAKITQRDEILSPSTVKCVFDQKGRALYFSRSPIPYLQNQTISGIYYRHIGVYCFRKNFLDQFIQLKQTPLQQSEDLEQLKILESGFPIHVCVVEDQAMGVDTPEDLIKIENLLCQKENTSSLQGA